MEFVDFKSLLRISQVMNLSKGQMKKAPPIELDYSAGAQPFLDIVCALNNGDYTYTIDVRDEHGKSLYHIISSDIKDRISIATLIAVELSRDPYFGFGRDQKPYRWSTNRWQSVEKWMTSLDFSMHALVRTPVGRRASNSLHNETLAAWQANADYSSEGLDLRAFGDCPGIPCEDGILKLDFGALTIQPHHPTHMNLRVLPIRTADAWGAFFELECGQHKESLFMRFIESSLEPDQLIAVRRWCGYHLLSNVLPNAEKMLYLWGSGANGKSQLLWLLRGLVGNDACAELRLSDLKISANTEKLVGALAMIGAEANTATDIELLKTLISREPISCNPKYRDPFTVLPECLITQASNHPPHFNDNSDAMERRTIALHLKRTFQEGKRIEDIAQRIIDTEYELLVGFALWGAHEISAQGKFTVPNSIISSSSETVSAGTPLQGFWPLLEFGAFEISIAELYAVYSRWCREEGISRPETRRSLQSGLDRYAAKSKRIINKARSTDYTPSTWNNGTSIELVAPNQKNVKRPEVLRGVRVKHDASGLCVGQDLPTSARVISLFT